jgi:hypothetical protein
MILVLAIVFVVAGVALVMVQAIGSAVHGLSHDLPQIADQAKHSGLGHLINHRKRLARRGDEARRDITSGAGKVSRGVAHVGVSAFGAIASSSR